jgi:ATP-dependent RNA helicase DeaD
MQSTEDPQTAEVTFEQLGLGPDSLSSIKKLGFENPSPIQAEFIPLALSGKDAIGQARTGTGKTAAFMLPVLEKIDPASKRVQAIALAPTRELCEQVAVEAKKLSADHPIKIAVIVGGRPVNSQIRALEGGAQVVVGTPGRVIDLINRGVLNLQCVDFCILDEADRMLDIGFRPDIEKILRRIPETRQTLLLSATLPPSVERLAQKYMKSPQRVDLSEDSVVVETIKQYLVTVDSDRKVPSLIRILAKERPTQCIVFCRTKRGADSLHKTFCKRLPEKKIAIMHGDIPQRRRDRVIRELRSGQLRMLIATDVVGRGIDISGISHIVNFDIPEYCDDYIHRVGRTGRMSSDASGCAITFVTREQGDQLTNIEMRINDMLPQYEIEGFEPARPQRPARRLNS